MGINSPAYNNSFDKRETPEQRLDRLEKMASNHEARLGFVENHLTDIDKQTFDRLLMVAFDEANTLYQSGSLGGGASIGTHIESYILRSPRGPAYLSHLKYVFENNRRFSKNIPTPDGSSEAALVHFIEVSLGGRSSQLGAKFMNMWNNTQADGSALSVSKAQKRYSQSNDDLLKPYQGGIDYGKSQTGSGPKTNGSLRGY